MNANHPDLDLFISYGVNRRVVALATGLPRASQRIDHWIWVQRLLKQGQGVAAITSADAEHDLGMKRKQWGSLIEWLVAEQWLTEHRSAGGQGSIWGYGPRVSSTDWAALLVQATTEHEASGQKLRGRPIVKQVLRLRAKQKAAPAEPETCSAATHKLSSSPQQLEASPSSEQDPAIPPGSRFPTKEMEGALVERNSDGHQEHGLITNVSEGLAVVEVIGFKGTEVYGTCVECHLLADQQDPWNGWCLVVDDREEVVFFDRVQEFAATLLNSARHGENDKATEVDLSCSTACVLSSPGQSVMDHLSQVECKSFATGVDDSAAALTSDLPSFLAPSR